MNSSGAKLKIGITGQMAGGKSFITKKLFKIAQRSGFLVKTVDADAIRIALLEGQSAEGLELQGTLIEYFGKEIEKKEGGVNRRRLSEIVFCDPTALAFMERKIDPLVLGRLEAECNAEEELILLDWALLVEKGGLSLVDYNVLLLECRLETQMARLSGGDLPDSQILRRLSLQYPPKTAVEEIRKAQQISGQGMMFRIKSDITPADQDLHNLLLRWLCAKSASAKTIVEGSGYGV